MKREQVEQLFYGKIDEHRRFTQDFPILPDVWIEFAEHPHGRCELLLTPHTRADAPTLARALRDRLDEEQKLNTRATDNEPSVLFNGSVVLAEFSFWELMRVAMPLTDWWARVMAPIGGPWTREMLANITSGKTKVRDSRMLNKFISIVGGLECDRRNMPLSQEAMDGQITDEQVEAFTDTFEGLTNPGEKRGLLWSVSKNRRPTMSLWRSRDAVKADAAERLFNVQTEGVRWAVLDTGVDARHPAFARRGPAPDRSILEKQVANEDGVLEFPTRVVRTYDFLRFKWLVNPDAHDPAKARYKGPEAFAHSAAPSEPEELKQRRDELRQSLRRSRALDWDLLEPFLRVPHTDKYERPKLAHGTHVAGIIAADWPEAKNTPIEQPIQGMCPGLEIYDIRVLGEDADEFTTIAALQFVRHLNAHKDLMIVHGVNLSMSVVHDVANYACGRTPICEECERVVNAGIVVVTAAGNRGFNKFTNPENGASGDYRFISITDPGNAESVITVGSTHRYMPHSYGVSYFSSRGPTGDGRTKPDLVAPGERIDSCAPEGDYETMDGTSQAAPHVSGAAALLIARNRELIGQPKRIKEILCKSATDLGREPRFQGAGMLDVLRAMQSI